MKRLKNNSRLIKTIILSVLYMVSVSGVIIIGSEMRISGGWSLIASVLMVLPLSLWCVYIIYRIQSHTLRHLIWCIFMLAAAWLIIRYFRGLFAYNVILSRYLWYMYMAPMVAISYLLFVLFIEIFYPSVRHKNTLYRIVGFFALAVIIFSLTNDLHHLVAKYPDNPAVGGLGKGRSTLYFVGVGFCISLIACGIVFFIVRVSEKRSFLRFMLPIVVLLALIIYIILFVTDTSGLNSEYLYNDFAVVYIFFILCFIEASIQSGIIRNGGKYLDYLKHCMTPLCVTDKRKEIIYKTDDFNWEEYIGSKNPDIVFTEKNIDGGTAIIRADYSEINKLKQQIESELEIIERNNRLLEKSKRMLEEEVALKARTELYDEIDKAVEVKVREIDQMIAALPDRLTEENKADVKNSLSEIKLRIGYLKQKSMLMLLSKTSDCLPHREFRMICEVIKSDIKSIGLFSIAFSVIAKENVSVLFALAFNDFVEYVAECFSFSGAGILITANTEKKFCVANIECSRKLPFIKQEYVLSDYGYVITVSRESEEEYRVVMRAGGNNA